MDDNEKRLQRYLDEIAQETIGEDMNLWPEIRAQVEKKRAQQFRFAFGLGRVATVIFALLVVSTVGYAFYLNQLGFGGDDGLIGVSQAELVTPLELVQTVNDINVMLVWAYADGNRISISYQVEHPINLAIGWPTQIELTDNQGNIIPGVQFFMGGGGGGGGGDNGRATFGSVASYDASAIQGNPKTLDLKLRMNFDKLPESEVPLQPMSGGGGGGGGSGGSGTSTEETPALIPIEPFSVAFDFTVPFIPALRFPEPQTVETKGLSITLQNVSIAPSITLADLCFDVPDDDHAWMPHFVIGETYLDGGHFASGTSEVQPGQPRCGKIALTALFKTDENPLKIVVDRLQSEPNFTEERINAFVQALTTAGFRVTLDPPINGQDSFGFSIDKFPDGLTGDGHDVINRYYDTYFREAIEGPWVFTFQIP